MSPDDALTDQYRALAGEEGRENQTLREEKAQLLDQLAEVVALRSRVEELEAELALYDGGPDVARSVGPCGRSEGGTVDGSRRQSSVRGKRGRKGEPMSRDTERELYEALQEAKAERDALGERLHQLEAALEDYAGGDHRRDADAVAADVLIDVLAERLERAHEIIERSRKLLRDVYPSKESFSAAAYDYLAEAEPWLIAENGETPTLPRRRPISERP